jgi:hypothetical protein
MSAPKGASSSWHLSVEVEEVNNEADLAQHQHWGAGCCFEGMVVGDEAMLSVLISALGNCTMSATLPMLSS